MYADLNCGRNGSLGRRIVCTAWEDRKLSQPPKETSKIVAKKRFLTAWNQNLCLPLLSEINVACCSYLARAYRTAFYSCVPLVDLSDEVQDELREEKTLDGWVTQVDIHRNHPYPLSRMESGTSDTDGNLA